MKKITLALAAALSFAPALLAQPTGYNTGMPFGLIGPKEIDHLEAYAKKEGVEDFLADVRSAGKNDGAALARVFAFSLKFNRLNQDARAYGHLIYCNFLSGADVKGLETYGRFVAAQPEPIRQRIRDFIYYDATQAPKPYRQEVEADVRKRAPLLFPGDYVFGAGNPLFGKR